MVHGTWMVSNDQRLGLWVGLWGWDNCVVENQRSTHFVPWLPAFRASRCRARHGPGTRQLVACNTPAHHCQDRLPQSPRSRPLHHEQSCPAAASASADRSSRLLHFLPAPTDTLRPSPGLSPHRQTSCSSPRTHSTMSTQQQAMVLDTILAIKRTLKRKAYGMQLAACAARPHPPTLLLGGPGLTAMAPRRLRRLGRLDRVHDQPRQQAQKDGEICEKRPPDIIEWSRRVQGGLLTPGPAPLGETPRADPPR